jgi:outer membrane receptor protein involved in Fe transport
MKALIITPALILAPLLVQAEDTDSVALDTVEITGQQEPLTEISVQKLLKVPGSGNDPLGAVSTLPGVTFGGRTSEPAVRGSSPDDNQYLVDFLPVGYIFHSDNSSILSDNVIEDFRLETSAWSPQYNNATGAVIEATSRSPYYDQSQLVIDASFLKAGIFYEQPVSENQSFYIAARQSLFQFYIENFLDDEDFQFTTLPEYYDYQGKYEIRISDRERVYFQVIGSRDKAGVKFEDDADLVLQDPGLSGNINFEAFFNSQGIVWQKLYDNGFGHKISFSQLEQKFAFNIGTDNAIDVKVNDYVVKSHFFAPLSYEHELQFGGEISESHIGYDGTLTAPPCDEFEPDCRIIDGDETVTGSGKPVVYSYDAFVQDIWAVSPDWTLTPGLAFAYDDYTEETFTEPRLQSRWQFSDAWWFTQAYGQHHILPANLGSYIEPFGNKDLKQQTAEHYELGLENQVRPDLLWKFEVYYKQLDNIIISKAAQDPYYADLSDAQYAALPRYSNEADGHAFGAEFFVNKNLTDRWYGWLSVAWSRTFRHNGVTDSDFSYNYDQPVIINMVGNYRISSGLEFGLKWRYQSGQLITPLEEAVQDADNPDLYNPVYGSVNSERLPAYHRLDVRLERAFTTRSAWDINLYAEVLNLYNRANVIAYEYTGADYSGKEDVTDLPLILSFGIKARY